MLAQIAREEEKLAALAEEIGKGRQRVAILKDEWENLKTGRSGYAPACENEWVPGVCAKVRSGGNRKAGNVCGECKNQRFVPATDEQIARHLKGLQVMGVYPLLLDETCWFLAADFDGDAWLEDVEAFAKTCTANGLTASVERSRSGHGAHVWFFFSEPVPVPQRVLIHLTSRLHIGKEGLPSPLLDQIKRLAAFQNPELYKKQSMRLSTALTPRVLRRFEESPSAIALPRGCLPASTN